MAEGADKELSRYKDRHELRIQALKGLGSAARSVGDEEQIRETLKAPTLPSSSELHSLRRTKFSRERVHLLIRCVMSKDFAEKELRAEEDSHIENGVHLMRFKDLLEMPIAWRVLYLPKKRFDFRQVQAPFDADVLKGLKVWQLNPRARSPRRSASRGASPRRVGGGHVVRMESAALSREAHLESVLFVCVKMRTQSFVVEEPRWLQVVPQDRVGDVLASMFNDPGKVNFRSARSLYEYVQENFLGISIGEVEAFVRRQEIRQVVAPAPLAGGVQNPIVATTLGWHQVDIVVATWDLPLEIEEGELKKGRKEMPKVDAPEYLKRRDALILRASYEKTREESIAALEFLNKNERAKLTKARKEKDDAELTLKTLVQTVRNREYTVYDWHKSNDNIREFGADKNKEGVVPVEIRATFTAQNVAKFSKLRLDVGTREKQGRDFGMIQSTFWDLSTVNPYGSAELLQKVNKAIKNWRSVKVKKVFLGKPRKDRVSSVLDNICTEKGVCKIVDEDVLKKLAEMEELVPYDKESLKEAWEAYSSAFETLQDVELPEKVLQETIDLMRRLRDAIDRPKRGEYGMEDDVVEELAGGAGERRSGRHRNPSQVVAEAAKAAQELVQQTEKAAEDAKERARKAPGVAAARRENREARAARKKAAVEEEQRKAQVAAAAAKAIEDDAAARAEAEKKLETKNPSPVSSERWPYLMNVMDLFSKFAWSFALKDRSGHTVATALERLWLVEGAPCVMQTDGGAEFVCAEVQRLSNRFNVQRRVCGAYNSQCSGAIERLNRTIRGSIRNTRLALDLRATEWVQLLPYVVFSYNTQKHSSTQLTPYLIQRGRNPREMGPTLPGVDGKAGPAGPCTAADGPMGRAHVETDLDKAVQEAAEEAEAPEEAPEGAADAAGDDAAPAAAPGLHLLAQAAHEEDGAVGALLGLGAAPLAGGADAAAAAFVQKSADAAKLREEFVLKGLRQNALGMVADSLIKSAEKPLTLHSLVRVDYNSSEIHAGLKRLLKRGIKRARDLPQWTQDVFFVTKLPQGDGVLYDVKMVTPVFGEADVGFVTRTMKLPSHSLLKIKVRDLTDEEIEVLKEGDDAQRKDLLDELIDLRPSGFRPFVAGDAKNVYE